MAFIDYEERRQIAEEAQSGGAYSERNVVLAIGGYDGKVAVGEVEVLDVLSASWEAGPPMLTPRRGLGVCVLGTHIFAVGGFSETCLNSLEILDLRTGWWQAGPPMKIARCDLAAAVFCGRVYAVGGQGGGRTLDATEVFDPKAWRWEGGPPLLRARSGVGASACCGRLYVLGGGVSSENSLEAMRDVEFLDECTGVGWVAAPAMVERRCDVAATCVSERLFAMGGYGGRHAPSGGSYLDSIEILDVASGDGWKSGPAMHRPRSSLGCTMLAGSIYVMGGAFAGIGTTTTEVLNVEGDTVSGDTAAWSMGPPIPGVHRWGMRLASYDALGIRGRLSAEEHRVLARCALMKEICLHDEVGLERAYEQGRKAGLDPRELEVAEAMLAKYARCGFMTGALQEM